MWSILFILFIECVHMFVCSRVCVFTCLYVHMFVCSHVCMFTCLYVHIFVCSHIYVFTCLCVHMFVCSHLCVLDCVHTCMLMLSVHKTFVFMILRSVCNYIKFYLKDKGVQCFRFNWEITFGTVFCYCLFLYCCLQGFDNTVWLLLFDLCMIFIKCLIKEVQFL